MTYRQQVSGHNYQFDGLVELMAKATPLRSGDELAGCAAESDAERAAAAWVLADLPLSTFLTEEVVPYETDDVTRLIIDTHDRDAFAPLSHLTVGGLRDWLLDVSSQPHSAQHARSGRTRSDTGDGGRGVEDHAQSGPDRGRRGRDRPRRVPHHDRGAGDPGDPTAAQPSDRRSARHRRGHPRRSAAGLRRRGDRHQPGHRLTARDRRTCCICSTTSGSASTSRRNRACSPTSRRRWS